MATLSPTDSQVAIHLADRALTPLISSSSDDTNSQSQLQALSSFTTAAIAAFDSASRLGLGLPQRIMIETSSSGPVILHSYIDPQSLRRHRPRSTRSNGNARGIIEQAREDLRPLSGTTQNSSMGGRRNHSETLVNGVLSGGYKDTDAEEAETAEDRGTVQPPPLLVASVVASSAGEAGEARRAAVRLERMGREFQREWIREQEEEHEPGVEGEDG